LCIYLSIVNNLKVYNPILLKGFDVPSRHGFIVMSYLLLLF
jgi:hypothetical protein